MMEERTEASENEVSLEKGIENELKVMEVEVGAESDGKGGCDDVVVENADNSYVLVSGSDVMMEGVEDGKESGDVLVELEDGEVLGQVVDGGQKADNVEDDKAHCVEENGVSMLGSDAEENHVGESGKDEVWTDVVEEVEIVDKEAEQGEVENVSKVEEPVEVSNKLEDVRETGNDVEVEYTNKLDDVQETVNVVGVSNKLKDVLETGNVVEVKYTNKLDDVQVTVNIADAEFSNKLEDAQKAGKVVEVEDSNKLDNVQETVNVTEVGISNKLDDVQATGNAVDYTNNLDDGQETENGAEVEISNKLDDQQATGNVVEIEYTNKLDDVQETEDVAEVVYSNKLEDVQGAENVIRVEFSNTSEDFQQTVIVAPSNHGSKSQQIIRGGGLLEKGIAIIGILNPDIKEKLDANIEFTESKESERAMEELEKENSDACSLDKETHDSENLELEKECNEDVCLDIKENQDPEVLVVSDAQVKLMVLEQAGHNNVIEVLLSGTNVIVNQEPRLSEDVQKLAIESDVSSVVKENGKCERFVHIEELDLNREEQNHSANVLPVEANAYFSISVILNDIGSDVYSGQNEKSEAACAILTEQEENVLEYEIQVDRNGNETAEVEQTMSKDIDNQDNKELGTEINDSLQLCVGTECVGGPSLDGNYPVMVDIVDVVEPDTDIGDCNVPIDNEWPELSFYNTKKKINIEPNNEARKSQESKVIESEKMHLTDPDRKEAHNVIQEDDKKEVVGALIFEETDGITSPSLLSGSSHSQIVSDGAASPSENEVATSEYGSKDNDTILNGKTDASKIEISSSEASSLALNESEVDSRPFFFLIKVPRFEDDATREQIKFAQQDIDEKTKLRDSYKGLIQTKKDMFIIINDDLEAAKLKGRAARDSLKAKRKEIDAAQAEIDKVNNAMTVEDIKSSIHIMEHRMQHETVPLSEEKQLMREIKRLKHFKEQLSSSFGTLEELEEALEQKDRIRDHLKSLKKELNSIRSGVQSAEIVTKAAKKKCFDEYAELNNLQLEYKAANDVRQEAYMSLVGLRRELAQKNKFFRMYKDTEKLANDYALSVNRKSLHSICVNQVEMVMELWNTNDQFREDYIKYNARSTLRRLKALDGRSLGPDEEPPSVPYIRIDRINHLEVVTNSLSQFPPPEQSKILVPSVAEKVEKEPVMDSSYKSEAKKQSKSSTAVSEVSIVSSHEITPVAEEVVKKLNEEEELAKKAEDTRKKEEEAKMLEQLQLEERAKAKEALERKKRMAERAQARAKLRANKEAEEREKEREKRQRKKEKRKDGNEDDKEKDFPAAKEVRSEVTKEANPTEKPATASKRHHKLGHYVKSTKTHMMPLNLRNRNRRKIQMWIWMGVAALAAVAMVLLWFGSLSYLAEQKQVSPLSSNIISTSQSFTR